MARLNLPSSKEEFWDPASFQVLGTFRGWSGRAVVGRLWLSEWLWQRRLAACDIEPPELLFLMLPREQGLRVLNLYLRCLFMTCLRHSPQRGQSTSTEWCQGESLAPVSGLMLFSSLVHRALLWQTEWFSQSSPPWAVWEGLCIFFLTGSVLFPGQFPLLSPLVTFEPFLKDFLQLSYPWLLCECSSGWNVKKLLLYFPFNCFS